VTKENREMAKGRDNDQVMGRGTPGEIGVGQLGQGQRWTAARKREVVLRLFRGEPLDPHNSNLKLGTTGGGRSDIFTDIVQHHPFHIIAYYCLLKCYNALKMHPEANQIVNKMNRLIRYDERAFDMFRKYNGLMPDFKTDTEHQLDQLGWRE
jgi:hypothetical protein